MYCAAKRYILVSACFFSVISTALCQPSIFILTNFIGLQQDYFENVYRRNGLEPQSRIIQGSETTLKYNAPLLTANDEVIVQAQYGYINRFDLRCAVSNVMELTNTASNSLFKLWLGYVQFSADDAPVISENARAPTIYSYKATRGAYKCVFSGVVPLQDEPYLNITIITTNFQGTGRLLNLAKSNAIYPLAFTNLISRRFPEIYSLFQSDGVRGDVYSDPNYTYMEFPYSFGTNDSRLIFVFKDNVCVEYEYALISHNSNEMALYRNAVLNMFSENEHISLLRDRIFSTLELFAYSARPGGKAVRFYANDIGNGRYSLITAVYDPLLLKEGMRQEKAILILTNAVVSSRSETIELLNSLYTEIRTNSPSHLSFVNNVEGVDYTFNFKFQLGKCSEAWAEIPCASAAECVNTSIVMYNAVWDILGEPPERIENGGDTRYSWERSNYSILIYVDNESSKVILKFTRRGCPLRNNN